MTNCRVIISGGGTGGHIYPALAIADGLKREFDAEILYLGGSDSMEESLAQKAGYSFKVLPTAPLAGGKALPKALWRNLKGVLAAKKIIKAFSPDLVVGTGGYAAAPVVYAAGGLHIPTLIHEQNAYPGKTNRFLADKVDTVCLTFDAAKEHLPQNAKIVLTGLPVRRQIIKTTKAEGLAYFAFAAQRPVLLITGGSQGAGSINDAAATCALTLLQQGVQVIHITGKKNYQMIAAKLQEQGVLNDNSYKVMPYLDKMEYALAAADLVVGRAGASFIAEILCRGIPSVLVPYPFAAANHQEENARALVKTGAAVLLGDGEINGDSLRQQVISLLSDQQRLVAMSDAALKMGRPAAIDNITSLCGDLIQKGKRGNKQ